MSTEKYSKLSDSSFPNWILSSFLIVSLLFYDSNWISSGFGQNPKDVIDQTTNRLIIRLLIVIIVGCILLKWCAFVLSLFLQLTTRNPLVVGGWLIHEVMRKSPPSVDAWLELSVELSVITYCVRWKIKRPLSQVRFTIHMVTVVEFRTFL